MSSVDNNHLAPTRVRDTLTSKPSALLSDKSNKLLLGLLAEYCVSLTTTVAGLCERVNGQWEFLGQMCVCFELHTLEQRFYLRFYSLEKKKMAYEVPVPAVGIDLRFDSSPDFGRLSHYDKKVHAIYGLQFVPNDHGRKESQELQQALLRQNAALLEKLKTDAILRTRELVNAAKGKDRFTKSALDDKVKADLANIRKATGVKEPDPEPKHESKIKRLMKRKKRSEGNDVEQLKPKISPKDIGMPMDPRHVQHIGVNKKGEVGLFDFSKDPELNYLLEQMEIRYDELLEKKIAQQKLDELIYGQGGIEKFKAELAKNGIICKGAQSETKPAMTTAPQGASIQKPKETESGIKQLADKATTQPAQNGLQDFPPSSPGRGLMRIPPPPMRDLMSGIRAFENDEGPPNSLSTPVVKAAQPSGGNEASQTETVESPFLANLESSLFEIRQIIAQPENQQKESSESSDIYSSDSSSQDFCEEHDNGQETH